MIFECMNFNHIESAAKIALEEYEEERRAVPILPENNYFNTVCGKISELVDHKLGVAALEGGELIGFLTCYEPWKNHFGTTMGTFSPIHAHGAAKENRRRIYSRLYEEVSEKWVRQGILSHCIALYTHNTEAVDSFFWNGFGLRCVDSIRGMDSVASDKCNSIHCCELEKDEIEKVVPLKNQLIKHLQSPPIFMPLFFEANAQEMAERVEKLESRFFGIKVGEEVGAYVEISPSGENFACDDPGMMNICGAYMLPQYRNSGMYSGLLSYLVERLSGEGYTRLGVDFESFNPTASGFWLKHFTPYTYSVARRIDERILNKS